ncbi:MAG: beta-ketoacyl-[acyl-carrier-protein] synthase family protein [Bacteroidetes bacterium]|nr:beta-ketoacyl-[acyl-carrier-protein] synthase family protein [Bacteroidota bacterium]MBL7104473.1 beta-ketoacyl-[acyl-carrier-protein] synthase family protein [Bacteroidales bacterium]
MSDKVFVTGIGIISAIGNNTGEVFNSLNLSATGIGFTSYLNTIHRNEIPVAGVKASNEELLEIVTPCDNLAYTRTALLGMIAAKEAVISSGIKDISEKRTGLVSATSVGGMDKSEYFFSKFIKDNKAGKLKDIITHDCGDSTEKIADYLGVKDYITTISTACSSSANSIMFGARLIKNGILDRVIAGGTDSLTKFTLNGFNTLMILDKTGCKPFDNNRNGLTLGEGAGFLVLESERAANSSNKEILCELKGYDNSCDAYHQTASSPEGYGAYLAMKGAIGMSRLSTDEIDYINAHGTGTVNNDLSEGKAIEKIFGNKIPKLSSTKSFTGHTLGAAGGIEAVLSVLSIKDQTIFPNLNFTQQMKELSFSPVTNLIKDIEVKNVLSNSFGFGGNNTTLVFSRV